MVDPVMLSRGSCVGSSRGERSRELVKEEIGLLRGESLVGGNRVVSLLTNSSVEGCEHREVALINRVDERYWRINTDLETLR